MYLRRLWLLFLPVVRDVFSRLGSDRATSFYVVQVMATCSTAPSSYEQPAPLKTPRSSSFLGVFRADVTKPSGNTEPSYIAVSSDLHICKRSDRDVQLATAVDFKKSASGYICIPLDRLANDVSQDDVDVRVFLEEVHDSKCLHVLNTAGLSEGNILQRSMKRKRDQEPYYKIHLENSRAAKQLFSFIEFAILPLRFLQDRVSLLTKSLPYMDSNLSSSDVAWKTVDCHAEHSAFANTLSDIAKEGGNILSSLNVVVKTATKFAQGADMVKQVSDVFAGLELIGPLFLTISLIARGVGTLIRAHENRKELPHVHERLQNCARECVGILCRAVQFGQNRVDKSLLVDMLLTVVKCWDTAQAAERLMLSRKGAYSTAEIQRLNEGLNELEEHLRRMRVLDFFQKQTFDVTKRLATAEHDIRETNNKLGQLGALIKDREEFHASTSSVPTVQRLKNIVKSALPKLSALKKALLGQNPVALTGHALVAGHGGVGKTTACIAMCHDNQIRRKFPDGIHFIDLSCDADDDVADLLCCTVGDSGGEETADEIMRRYKNHKGCRDPLKNVVRGVRKWFKKRKVLFIFDNVMYRRKQNGTSRQEWSDLLCDIVGDAPESQILFCSRHEDISKQSFNQIHFGVLDMNDAQQRSAAIRLIEKYAGQRADLSANNGCDVTARDRLVEICDGLQLCLCVAGSMVRNTKGSWQDAMKTVRIKNSLVSVKVSEVSFHDGLKSVMSASLKLLHSDEVDMGRKLGQTCRELEENSGRSFSSMYSSFSILRSARSVPLYLWGPLFGVGSELEAKSVAMFFEAMGLAQRREVSDGSQVLVLHDMQHEFARILCIERRELGSQHRAFVNAYKSRRFRGSTVDWSALCRGKYSGDDYMANNLLYHLVGCLKMDKSSGAESNTMRQNERFSKEIVSVLADFKWIRARSLTCGRSAILEDFRIALTASVESSAQNESESQSRRSSYLKDSEGRAVYGGQCIALNKVRHILSNMYFESFGKSSEACEDHALQGGQLALELFSELGDFHFKGDDPVMVKDANDVLNSLKESMASSVKGPLVIPIRGMYQGFMSDSASTRTRFRVSNSFLKDAVFVAGGKFLLTFDMGGTVVIYDAENGYHELIRQDVYIHCGLRSDYTFVAVPAEPCAEEDVFGIACCSEVVLYSISCKDNFPKMEKMMKLIVKDNAPLSKPSDNDDPRLSKPRCVTASRGAKVIVAADSRRMYVWRRPKPMQNESNDWNHPYHVPDRGSEPSCIKYRESNDLDSKLNELYLRITEDGSRIVIVTIDSVDRNLLYVYAVNEVFSEVPDVVTFQLEPPRCIDIIGRVVCPPFIAKDSRMAYICVNPRPSALHQQTFPKYQKIPGHEGVIGIDLLTIETTRRVVPHDDSFNSVDMWEDGNGRVPPLLIVVWKKRGIECLRLINCGTPTWSLQPVYSVSPALVAANEQNRCILCTRRPEENINDIVNLEVVVERGDGVVRVFAIPYHGNHMGEGPGNAIRNAEVREVYKGKSIRFTTENGSVQPLEWEFPPQIFAISHEKGACLVMASYSEMLLLDACTGKLLDKQQTENDCLTAIDVSRNGSCILAGFKSGIVSLWKVAEDSTGQLKLFADQREIYKFDSDIRFVVICQDNVAVAADWGRIMYRKRKGDTKPYIKDISHVTGSIQSLSYCKSRTGAEEYISCRIWPDGNVLLRFSEQGLHLQEHAQHFEEHTQGGTFMEQKGDLETVCEVLEGHRGGPYLASPSYESAESSLTYALGKSEEIYVHLPQNVTTCQCTFRVPVDQRFPVRVMDLSPRPHRIVTGFGRKRDKYRLFHVNLFLKT